MPIRASSRLGQCHRLIKGLQKLVSKCTEFGREYGVTYNSIKSMCIAFCKGKARNFEEMPRIYL